MSLMNEFKLVRKILEDYQVPLSRLREAREQNRLDEVLKELPPELAPYLKHPQMEQPASASRPKKKTVRRGVRKTPRKRG
jgi:hypothetical protein